MPTGAAAVSPAVEPIDTEIVDPAVVADQAVTEASADANPAASSPVDTDAKEPADLLSVIRSAVEKPAEPVASSDPVGDPVAPPAEEKPAEAGEPSAEDDANLPFHNHPRWKAVIAERDSLRDPAERFGHITSFMQQHGLSNEEVTEGYEIMALLKSGDPEKLGQAREWFADRLSSLDATLGNVLPGDLQTKVEEGLLDEEGAQEIARSRAAASLRTSQETERTARETRDAQQRDADAITTAMVGAVEAWEARTKSADPDYSKKADLVQAKCQAIVTRTGKPPRTAAEATALADQALAEVNAIFKAALPKPRAVSPTPAGVSTTAAAAPTTLRGAIDAALGR